MALHGFILKPRKRIMKDGMTQYTTKEYTFMYELTFA